MDKILEFIGTVFVALVEVLACLLVIAMILSGVALLMQAIVH